MTNHRTSSRIRTTVNTQSDAVRLTGELIDGNRGDLAAAVMHEALRRLDPRGAEADPLCLDAVLTYLRMLEDQPGADLPTRTTWARYAYRTAQQLHGRTSHHAALAAERPNRQALSARATLLLPLGALGNRGTPELSASVQPTRFLLGSRRIAEGHT